MKKVIHTFNERIANPNLQLIDFEMLNTNKKLYTVKVIEEYWLNDNFRGEVKVKLKNDVIFKRQFQQYFPELYQEIYQEILNSQKKKIT